MKIGKFSIQLGKYEISNIILIMGQIGWESRATGGGGTKNMVKCELSSDWVDIWYVGSVWRKPFFKVS